MYISGARDVDYLIILPFVGGRSHDVDSEKIAHTHTDLTFFGGVVSSPAIDVAYSWFR